MTPERYERLWSLYEAAVQQAPNRRQAFLDCRCADDEELRAELERLLACNPTMPENDALAAVCPVNVKAQLQSAEAAKAAAGQGNHAEPPLPERIGRYRLHEEISHGGMAVIVRVEDEVFCRPLAMKVPRIDRTTPQLNERFVREARLTAQLQHPGIPPVQEMGHLDDGRPFFIMKLVKGDNLQAMLAARSSIGEDLTRFVTIFEQLCQTLSYVHSRGIIHRDVKPENVMVGTFGEVQVMDWGLAKLLIGKDAAPAAAAQGPSSTVFLLAQTSMGAEETAAGAQMGTPAYMAPEQARGETEVLDTRCDVFGLGGILCAILTGTPPFAADSAAANVRLAMKGDLADAIRRLHACDLDADLVSLAKKCLSADSKDRPTHAGSVAAEITRYQAALQDRMQQAEIKRAAAEARAEAEQARAQAERKRRRTSVAFAVLAVLLVLGTAGTGLWFAHYLAARSERHQQLERALSDQLAELVSQRQQLQNQLQDPLQASALLSDIDGWKTRVDRMRETWQRTDGVVRQAEASLLDESWGDRLAEQDQLIQTDEVDWLWAKRLDEIRLEAGLLIEGKLNAAMAAPKYSEAFAELGLPVANGVPAQLAEDIRQRRIRTALVAALDHWATVLPTGGDALPQILEIARLADPDPWGDQVRDPEIENDKNKLLALAGKALPEKATPQLVLLLATKVTRYDRAAAAGLVRKATLTQPRDFWLYFTLGKTANDAAEQAGCYRAALALRPDSSAALNNLGIALNNTKDAIGAIKCYEKALKPGPRSILYNNLGIALRNQGDEEGAIRNYNQAIELDPKNAMPHYNLGLAWHRQQKHDDAIAQYKIALELDPKYAAAHNDWGVSLKSQGDLAGAIEHWRQAIALKFDYALAHSNLGRILYDQQEKDLPNAVLHLKKAVEFEPTVAAYHYHLGNALKAGKETRSAIESYRNAIARASKYADAHYRLGSALVEQKDYDSAVRSYKNALECGRKDASVHYNLGVALYLAKDYDGSIEPLKVALQLGRNDHLVHGYLGGAYAYKREKAYDAAIKHYDWAIELNAKYSWAHYNRGYAWSRKREYEKAIVDYSGAIDLNPKYQAAYRSRGYAWSQKKEYDKSLADYGKAIELDPTDAIAYNNRGNSWRERKEYDKAIKDHDRAIHLNPKYVNAFSLRGKAQYLAQRYDEALASWQEALKLDPTYSWALMRWAHLLATCPQDNYRDGKKALELANKALSLEKAPEPEFQEMLAAVFAEAGNFKEAVRWQERALQARSLKEDEAAHARLELYRNNQPYRQP